MRFAGLLLALLVSLAATAASPELERKALLGGKVSMLIPSAFQPLSQEMLLRKYPNPMPPNLVYANETGSVSIAMTHSSVPMTTAQLPAALEQMAAGVKTAQPNAKWFRSEMTTLNGRPFFITEFQSAATDTDVRNIIVGTSVDDRLLIVAFNTTVQLAAAWLPAGKEIIQSITVK